LGGSRRRRRQPDPVAARQRSDLHHLLSAFQAGRDDGGRGEAGDAQSGLSPAGKSDVLFEGPLDNVAIRWSPDGNLPPKDAPPNHEKKARLQLVLQGEFIVDVSNGQEVRVKPGNLLLQEDSTGYGHKMRCYAPQGSLGCVQMTMDAVDPVTFFANVAK
jgi:hypothetical protein